jgi:hypothetical protein
MASFDLKLEYEEDDYDSSSGEEDEVFPLVVHHRGVEISFLGVSGDGSDIDFNREALVQQLSQKDCEVCRRQAIQHLDLILFQYQTDRQIGEWCCTELDKRNPDANAQIATVSHSPKSCAVELLMSNYKCGICT